MSRQPRRDMHRRQRRRRKVRHLRERLKEETNPHVRRRLIVKIQKIAPTAPVPDD